MMGRLTARTPSIERLEDEFGVHPLALAPGARHLADVNHGGVFPGFGPMWLCVVMSM
jgi:hypothetical protein